MPLQRGLRRAASAASEQASTAGYLTGWRVVRWLPEPAARSVFDRIADQVHRRDGRSVQRLRANLARTVPAEQLDATTREGVRSYLRYWCESFRLPSWDVDDLVRRTRVVGEERLRGPQQAGRGVVAALPHMGNWDWAGAWACATGMPLTTVAERLEPARLLRRVRRLPARARHARSSAHRRAAADAPVDGYRRQGGRLPARRP